MRPYGRAVVSRTFPQAHAICDRCGFRYNHHMLRWQYAWIATKLQNIRLLVCESCYDTPQEQLRRIVIPPDPIPIRNPRPEIYPNADNPISTVGYDPITGYGDNFGTTSNIVAAFDGNTNKKFRFSAIKFVSINGLANYVGKNWNAYPGNISAASGVLTQQVVTYNVTQFVAYAPTDAPFIGGGASVAYKFQGSLDGVSYTDLASGNTAGSVAEVINTTLTVTGYYQYHRIIFTGDGTNSFGIAQLLMYGTPVSEEGGL